MNKKIERRKILLSIAGLAGLGGLGGLISLHPLAKRLEGSMSDEIKNMNQSDSSELMPTIFFGHGSPMNVLERNKYTDMFSAQGEQMPRPRAILCVSAHWVTTGTKVQISEKPKQIFDFYGFPEELYKVFYTPEGSPQFGQKTADLNSVIKTTNEWGLDHGTWAVLHHMYPKQDVPVFQLSLDKNLKPMEHFEIAKSLFDLRKLGVLIIGSGNIVHNLGQIKWDESASPHAWALDYEKYVLDLLTDAKLSNEEKVLKLFKTQLFSLSHPTPEHLFPLLYTIGTADDGPLQIITSGIQNGSISMAAVRG